MAINLKNLTLPEAKIAERQIWVNFKGVEFKIRYVSAAGLRALADSCKIAAYDPTKKGRTVTLDPDKFTEGLAKAIVVTWRKATPRNLASLYPMNLDGLSDKEKDEEIEFTTENLLEVLKNANLLDDFLQESATEAALFKPEADASLEKNSSTSQSIT